MTILKNFFLIATLIITPFLCSCDQIQKNKDLTPLISAVIYQRVDEVNALLVHGANPNETISNGNTALIFAAAVGNTDIIQSLIKHGAKVNKKNNEGVTPLIAAGGAGYITVAQLLLQANANICAQAINHLNAAQTADAWGNHETAMFLQNYQNAHNIHCGK